MNIGDRLREERERLGFSQTDFAGLGGAKRHSQIDWESGKSFPNAKVLAAIAAAGADVQYILTGIRGHAVVSETSASYTHTRALTTEEEKHLDNLAHCTKEDQEAIKRMAFIAATAKKDEKKPGTRKKTA